jgi:predicted DNA binding CopG/RHH family protein
VETTIESDGDQVVERMDDMVDDIRNEYLELQNNQALPEDVKEFYKLLEASEAKVHEGTDVTVLQAVTRLMAMKSKYSFSNNCYNDIVELIIDLIPSNHNMPKDFYHCKKIVASHGMNYQKIDSCEDNCMLFWKEHEKTTYCIHCSK